MSGRSRFFRLEMVLGVEVFFWGRVLGFFIFGVYMGRLVLGLFL